MIGEAIFNRRDIMKPQRHGTAAIAMVVTLLILNLIVIAIVVGGGRDHDLTVRRIETIQAFYAADSGMNMAIREKMEGVDEDVDGGVGTISADDPIDDANDPAFGTAQVVVTVLGDIYTSRGRSGKARREMEAEMK